MKERTHSLYRDTLCAIVLCGTVLFACGVIVSGESAGNSSIQLLLVSTATATSVLLFVTLARCRRRLTTVDLLERQLSAFVQPSEENRESTSLQPIMQGSRVSNGWNRIVDLVANRNLDQQIERRLQGKTNDRQAERFGRMIRSLAEGVATTDRSGTVHYANPSWIGLVSGELEDESHFLGQSILNWLARLEATNWSDVSPSLLEGTRPLSISLQLGTSTHHGILQLNRMPLEGRINESEGFVWVLKDVTQQVLANEAHEQFLSSATHELRTPLTNIRAYTESLLEIESISPEQQREFFNVIYAEAGRLGRLLNQLLDIQQLEAGSMTVQSAPFDVLRMVHEIQEHISPLVEEKGLQLNCRIAPSLKTMTADKDKVTSCLVNLLGNAVKYTPEGGEIRLIAEQQDTHLTLTVEDNGIGIAEGELTKIFERFYRSQDDRVGEIEGNGLGLSFCMEVARLHGGELTVESQFNKGSRFTLRIPLVQRS